MAEQGGQPERRIGRVLVARVVGIAQESPFGGELEPGGFDFLAQKRLLDAMERAGHQDELEALLG